MCVCVCTIDIRSMYGDRSVGKGFFFRFFFSFFPLRGEREREYVCVREWLRTGAMTMMIKACLLSLIVSMSSIVHTIP